MRNLILSLQTHIEGEVFAPCGEAHRYGVDESIFEISPTVIVCPKSSKDVQTVVQIAAENRIPITARGGGTGVAGQSIGSGIVLDFSRAMNAVLDISENEIVVEPGLGLRSLQQLLKARGRAFAPDPGSWKRCTIGGMIGTNAAGPRSLRYGSTRDHVISLDTILYDAREYSSSQLGNKYRYLLDQIQSCADLIRSVQPKVEKNSSGYFLQGLLDPKSDFAPLIVGSEGTLGLVTRAVLRTIATPQITGFSVFTFPSTKSAIDFVQELRDAKPACIELLDEQIVGVLREFAGSTVVDLAMEDAASALWVEWHDIEPLYQSRKPAYFTRDINHIEKIWHQRSEISPYLHAKAEKMARKPLRCIEDACLPLDALSGFYDDLLCILIDQDAEGAVFGHVGSGHLHVNPGFRIDLPDVVSRLNVLMDQFYELVLRYRGTISGEHGDGLLRRPYAKVQWAKVWHLFESVKAAFDPDGIFNPDKKVPSKRSLPEAKIRGF